MFVFDELSTVASPLYVVGVWSVLVSELSPWGKKIHQEGKARSASASLN